MIGEIKMFAGSESALDINHIPCDGRALSRAVYSDLFAIIGTLWGSGDGSTTFNIPDLRDKFIRGSGASRAVGTSQSEQNAFHSHSLTINSFTGDTSSSGSHIHTYPLINGNIISGSTQYHPVYVTLSNHATGDTSSSGVHTHSISHSHTADCSPQGGSELRPANIALLYVIQVFNESSSGSQGLTEEQSIQLQKVSDFIDAIASNDYTKAFKFTGSDGREFYLTEELIKYCNQFK